jgi:fructose-specific phosphotransferase system IIC component
LLRACGKLTGPESHHKNLPQFFAQQWPTPQQEEIEEDSDEAVAGCAVVTDVAIAAAGEAIVVVIAEAVEVAAVVAGTTSQRNGCLAPSLVAW